MSMWVNVTDKLPKDFEPVLILTHVGDISVSSIQLQTVTCANHKRIQIRTWQGAVNPQVEYWHPLPKTPKEEVI